VQEKVADKFVHLLKNAFETATKSGVIGDPSDKNTQAGPLADKAQFKRVMEFFEIGKKDGELVTGGVQWGSTGLFVEPTIFRNPIGNSRIVREEVFGPVVTVQTFKTEEEAVMLANDSAFGLSGKSLILQKAYACVQASHKVVKPASTQVPSAEHSGSPGRLKQEQSRSTTGISPRRIPRSVV
jgi:acyl-CoA reductase-like NAD-dependent aldehyde dehydrogenase